MKLPKFTKPYRLRDYNFTLVTLVFILSVIGILVVGSAKQVYQAVRYWGHDRNCLYDDRHIH